MHTQRNKQHAAEREAALAAAQQHNLHQDEDFSDGEDFGTHPAGGAEETLDTIRMLPVEERRKALRRLRNRESARRVRARRLAEMSTMEEMAGSLQEENAGLRNHISQLQSHIQSMTVKIYEVTAKYEAAVAENIRLKTAAAAGKVTHSTSYSGFDSSHPIAPQPGAQSQRPSITGQLPLLSGSSNGIAMPAQDLLGGLGNAVAASSGLEPAKQRQAMEEIVMMLQQHRHRSELLAKAQDPSASASSGPHTSHSPSLTDASLAGTPAANIDNDLSSFFGTVDQIKQETLGNPMMSASQQQAFNLGRGSMTQIPQQQGAMFGGPANMLGNPSSMGCSLNMLNRSSMRNAMAAAPAVPQPCGANSGPLGCVGGGDLHGWSSGNNLAPMAPAAPAGAGLGGGLGLKMDDFIMEMEDLVMPQDL